MVFYVFMVWWSFQFDGGWRCVLKFYWRVGWLGSGNELSFHEYPGARLHWAGYRHWLHFRHLGHSHSQLKSLYNPRVPWSAFSDQDLLLSIKSSAAYDREDLLLKIKWFYFAWSIMYLPSHWLDYYESIITWYILSDVFWIYHHLLYYESICYFDMIIVYFESHICHKLTLARNTINNLKLKKNLYFLVRVSQSF